MESGDILVRKTLVDCVMRGVLVCGYVDGWWVLGWGLKRCKVVEKCVERCGTGQKLKKSGCIRGLGKGCWSGWKGKDGTEKRIVAEDPFLRDSVAVVEAREGWRDHHRQKMIMLIVLMQAETGEQNKRCGTIGAAETNSDTQLGALVLAKDFTGFYNKNM